jgi:tetratricopeptide (TPR) repeat protein
MRRISLSAALLLAVITGPLSGCAHTGSGMFTNRAKKMEATYDIARLAESDGQFDKAREGYEAIYKKDPKIAEVSHRLGLVYAKQQDYETAKRYLAEAHSLAPTNVEILNDLGYTHYCCGEHKLAEAQFDKALKLSKNDKRATNNLALVYGTAGRMEESYRMFRLVNSEDVAHQNVAWLYAQNGDGKSALEHYNRALTVNPGNKKAAQGMLEIADMQAKLEADRAQIAQQQNKQTPVAQANPQAQPKVYEQLTAGRPEQPAAVAAATPASMTSPRTAVASTQPAPQVEQVIASRDRTTTATTKEDFEESVTPAIEVTTTRRGKSPAAAAVATPVEEKQLEVKPVETKLVEEKRTVSPANVPAIANRTSSELKQPEQAVVSTQSEGRRIAEDLADLQPSERTLAVARNEKQEVASIPAEELPVLGSEFEEPAAVEATAVITPVRSDETASGDASPAVPPAHKAPSVDYLALCPDATDLVKPLLVQMNSQDGTQSKLALHRIGELLADGKSAAPAVYMAMSSADPYVRIHAALACWRIEQNAEDTVPIFQDGLRSPDANVRSFAATALATGPQVNQFIAPLTAALTDPNPFVRLHSAETLYKYPGQEGVATKALIGHLTDQDTNIRWLATFIMGETLPKSPEAVQALSKSLADEDHRIRAGAAFALGGLGSNAQAALPELRKMNADVNPEVRRSVEDAIQNIEQTPPQASASR